MNWMLMPLRRYADFGGRSRRMEFWMWQLFLFLVNMVVFVIAIAIIGGALFALMSGNPGAFDSGADYSYDGSADYAGDVPVGGLAAIGIGGLVIFGLLALWGLFILIPNLAVAIRRLHDTNRTGWWILAPLAPYLVAALFGVLGVAVPDLAIVAGLVSLLAMLVALGLAVMLLVFYCLEGTRGPNRFGPDPKGPSHEETFR